MNAYNIEFTPDKKQRLNTIIVANDITEAYLEFVKRFPAEYIITDITWKKELEKDTKVMSCEICVVCGKQLATDSNRMICKECEENEMKAIVKKDRRGDTDRKFDDMWNKLCREAKLNPVQSNLVARYLRELMGMRIHEIESAVDMAWLIALIEGEKFGTDVKKGAKRLLRVQQNAVNARNEAFGKGCFDANGNWDNYDGCGIEHLKVRLSRYGVEYDTEI